MLTNLDFLKVGRQWPPPAEKIRLDKYEKNRLIFEGQHEMVYAESFKRISRVIGNFNQIVSYHVIANFQKLISLKVADFMLGEEPKITCGDDNSKHQTTIDLIKENSDLINTCYSAAIDVSRFGDSVFNIYIDEEGKGIIDITQPSFYFKVVDERNLRKVVNHVLAHTFEVTTSKNSIFGTKEQKEKRLHVQIHYKGYYEEIILALNDQGVIQGFAIDGESKRINTGLKDFAIIPIHNVLTSDRSYGMDDYTDLDSIISELEVRVSQISKILDKHAEPSMQGPEESLEYNEETGELEVKAGNYFIVREGQKVEYLTWEAQLESNFKIIEKLINILATVSEMGSALFDSEQKTSQAASGTALRRMMISPLAKVNRTRMRFDSSLKKAIKLCSQLGGEGVVDLSKENINIFWQDGLPSDPVEEAEVMAIRTGNKSTISQYSAIQRLDNLSDEDTAKELEAIKQDEVNSNPLLNMNFDYGANENEESEE